MNAITYRLLPSCIGFSTIEATRPIFGEAVEICDAFGPTGQYRDVVIGTEMEVLHFRLAGDGTLCIDSASADFPGWHHVETLPAGSTEADVLAWVRGKDFMGRQFWRRV